MLIGNYGVAPYVRLYKNRPQTVEDIAEKIQNKSKNFPAFGVIYNGVEMNCIFYEGVKMRVLCGNCNIEFEKENSQIKPNKRNYCSRSCAAKINNKLKPKRKVEGMCLICNCSIPSRLKKCKTCRKQRKTAEQINKNNSLRIDLCQCGGPKQKRSTKCSKCISKIGELKTKLDFEYKNNGNKASQYTRIREHARKIAKDNGLYDKGCKICGYTKHIEICHIKSIKDFDNSTLIIDINDISNLLPLCPNCHWEFDHPQS